MHACGRGIHITNAIGGQDARATKDQWRGTLILIGQPAEETVDGAKAMLADGLYTFPKPALRIAATAQMWKPERSRIVGLCPMASSTSVDLSDPGARWPRFRPESTKDHRHRFVAILALQSH